MSKSLDDFIKLLLQSGMVTESDLKQLQDSYESAEDDEEAVQQIADSGHLTDFQKSEVLQGKADSLVLGENLLILDRLGQGGMGQVFRARHTLMKRDVAVKFRLPSKDDERSDRRFAREVEAASKLTHPNIVHTLNADHQGDMVYLMMEYVRGQNLQRVVRSQGPMSFSKALDCILQAAEGLEYAHQQGVIHRDIKPSNLLLTEDGSTLR